MIYTRLAGGLGNQLFQYAAARALALRLGTSVVLDPRHYDRDASRAIRLQNFKLQVDEADLPGRTPLDWIMWRIGFNGPRRFSERGLSYNAEIAFLTDPVYLVGYWQSERYFRDVSDQIRAELELKSIPDEQASRLLEAIVSRPSMSLHVRRGDYVSDQSLGTCGPEYYLNAAMKVAERTAEEPIIYAFSDDPDWVRAELKLPFEMVIVDLNGPDRPEEDLRLMSACDHHVIANSTFSWWGAWLNPSKEKIVIAPTKWFPNPGVTNPDILPPEWETIDGGL